MQDNLYENDPRQPAIDRRPANSLATAALVLGILAILATFTMTVIPSVFLGSLAIILGILSRGSDPALHRYAKSGILISAGTIALNIVLLATSLYTIFSNPKMAEQYWQIMNESYEQMTGMTFDELMESYGLTEEPER